MGEVSIAVEARAELGKSANRRLRASGRVPGVVYSRKSDPISVSLDPVQLERKIQSSHAGINTLFDLEGEGSVAGRTVIVKELQRDPVRGSLLHADFHEIDMTQRLHISVPIHLDGEAPGVGVGGVIEHTLREVELACLPGSIPDEVMANISALEIGDSLHVSDLSFPEGVEVLTDEALSVVSVMLPKVVEEAVPEPDEDEGEGEGEGGAEAEAEGEGAEATADSSSESEKAEENSG